MCGIIGVTGNEPALPVLLDGLSRLDYRGYDSAGVALVHRGSLWRRRRNGRLDRLRGALDGAPDAAVGIGHTRWATHGRPSEANAHPHIDCGGRVAIVHNGIVENHRELRGRLQGAGHRFTSDTDSEVLAHLVEEELEAGQSLAHAVAAAVRGVEGSLAVAVVDRDDPTTIVVTRRGSPLIVGRRDDAGLLASDVPALLPHTGELYAVHDDQVVEVRPGSLTVASPAGGVLQPERRAAGWNPADLERGDHPHFMLKEIHEQPRAIAATIGGRRAEDDGALPQEIASRAHSLQRIVLVACGTSLHAAMAARPAFVSWARLPVTCEIASEFRYQETLLDERVLVIGVSQSGETIDTLYALNEARRRGAPTIALTNVDGAALARVAAATVITRAGPEIGVAATKTHTSQIVALQALALALGEARHTVTSARAAEIARDIQRLPDAVARVIDRADRIRAVARRHAGARDFFYLGRGTGHAVALEGALKLKEIAYVRAEAFAAGEMKHGPIALIEPGVIIVGVVDTGPLREKMLSNIAEMRARGASIVLLAADDDAEAAAVADDLLLVPAGTADLGLLLPAVQVVVLQLFAYGVAVELGLDVDKPRNLAKTVTVE